LLQGAIDVHIHANPHIFPQNHAQDALALASDAMAAGMRALAIKDLGGSTTGSAYFVSRLGPGIPVYGTHVMNISAGGVNPRAVWASLTHGDGARVVHFPAGDSRNHFDYRKRYYAGTAMPLTEDEAISVEKDGKLIEPAREIIRLVKEQDSCIATCHLSAAESHLVVREAKDQGLERIIISHANWAMTRLTNDDLEAFAKLGCLIEFECAQTMPLMYFVHGEAPADPRQIVKVIKQLGAEHCFLSSDLGQVYSPRPVEGMRTYIGILMKCGLSSDEIRIMLHQNPARILGLD
jgi:hypothetical protein